ncbi:MAG: hypothetical protein QW103_00025 [Candidatus Pacearchaeota archaeon]
MERDILWCGADDSNHAGSVKGEFIVVTFSILKEDSIVKEFPNHRERYETNLWLQNLNRDYRFTLLTNEEYRHKGDNVAKISPFMVVYYLREKKERYKQINLYLDGWLKADTKRLIREIILKEGIEKVVVDNFTKKGVKKFQKRHNCPELVYRADNISHILFEENWKLEELIKNKNFILFKDIKEIAKEKGYYL